MSEQTATTPVASPARGTVLIRKTQNVIDISPDGNSSLPDELRRLLEPELKYQFVQCHYGRDQIDPISGHRRKVTIIPKHIYRYDKLGRLVTNFGFVKRLFRVLQGEGFEITTQDLYPDSQRSRADCYKPEWTNVTDQFEFWPRQDECLRSIMRSRCGVVYAVTGSGKMAMMAMTCLLFPRAKIYVVTKGRSLVSKTREYLLRYLPNVGQFGDGVHKYGQRVTVFSVDSLHHCDFDCDFLLADEGHLLISEESSKELVKFQDSRNFTFTATPHGRLDGTDKRLEALFGETIFYLPYQEAVGLGLVAQIRVEWSNVALIENPVENIDDDVQRKRRGIWCNGPRNDIIAQKALEFPDDQVMIIVDTVEHGANLMQRLHPHGYTLVTDEINAKVFQNYQKSGMIPLNYPRMTPALREKLRQQFEAGELRKVITTVWDTGIDPRHLGVVIRATGGASEIQDQQEPGRVSRIVKDEHGNIIKKYGVLCDFLDQFDPRFSMRATGRLRTYRKMGWENVIIHNGQEREL